MASRSQRPLPRHNAQIGGLVIQTELLWRLEQDQLLKDHRGLNERAWQITGLVAFSNHLLDQQKTTLQLSDIFDRLTFGLVIFLSKNGKSSHFQLVCCEDLLPFFVLLDIKLAIFWCWSLCGQNEEFDGITLGSKKLWWAFLTNYWLMKIIAGKLFI